ncbi:MAG: DUF4411 family protein [Bacteroidales bacterium]|nr:DUF4411 family protein [Bacteroidales bacterium]
MSVYVIDTNFFIQAHRVYYPLDVVSSFWNKVKQLADEEKIISIDKVKDEIYKNDDALKIWCEDNLSDNFFKDSSQSMLKYRQVAAWAASRNTHFSPNAIAEFLDAEEADAFIIAYALTDNTNRIIVTQEVSDPNCKRKIKIPDVCISLNIRYVNVIDMFRQLGETF